MENGGPKSQFLPSFCSIMNSREEREGVVAVDVVLVDVKGRKWETEKKRKKIT